jgi:peptidoglycan/LPS O-acetylase OafA/YrhL
MQKNEHKLAWIQALRGIAVLLVVLTHARYYLLDTERWPMASTLFYPGAMGVDLFFIISGFIMVYTTQGASGGRAALYFGIKRFSRIWPVYAVIALLFIGYTRDLGQMLADPALRELVVKTLALYPVDPATAPYFSLLLPTAWTLAFEMYFYLVFGLCLLAGRLRWFVFGAWMLLTLVLLPATHGGPVSDVRSNLHFHSAYMQLATSPMIYEFVAGVLIGLLYQWRWARFPNASLAWQLVFLALGLPLWYAYAGIGNFHGPLNWGWPLALMVLVLALASKTVVLRPPHWLVWIGTISYSMYLTHLLNQQLLTRYMERWGFDVHGWGQVFLTVLLAVPVASLSYQLLELRLGGAVKKFLLRIAERLWPVRLQAVHGGELSKTA